MRAMRFLPPPVKRRLALAFTPDGKLAANLNMTGAAYSPITSVRAPERLPLFRLTHSG